MAREDVAYRCMNLIYYKIPKRPHSQNVFKVMDVVELQMKPIGLICTAPLAIKITIQK